MKVIKVNSKSSGLLAKGVTALLLLVVLQGKNFCVGGGTANDPMTRAITRETKVKELPGRLSELSSLALAKRLPNILYDLVTRNELDKLKEVLAFCNKPKAPDLVPNKAEASDSDVKRKLIEALNREYKDGTLLAIAIKNGYKNIFNFLLKQEGIDINKAGDPKAKNPTTALSTLKYKRQEMFEDLMKQPNVDITTIDPISGDTALHLAISNTNALLDIKKKWPVIAETLINLFQTQVPYLLSQKNNEGKTPLDLAIDKKLEKVTLLLIDKLPEEDLKVKNEKLQTPIQLVIDAKLEKAALLLIDKLPEEDLKVKNEKLQTPIQLVIQHGFKREVINALVNKLSKLGDFYEKDDKGKTVCHVSARGNNYDAFEKVLIKASTLSSKQRAVTKLFTKDKKGHTVFASAYLPKHKKEGWIHIREANLNMFKGVLSIVKDNLNEGQWQDVTNEINALENKKTIKKEYADKLREIVKSIRPFNLKTLDTTTIGQPE